MNEIKFLLEAIEEAGATAIRKGQSWRATYTKEDKAVVELLSEYMKEAGMKISFDAVGNLYERIDGNSSDVIMIGSHRDTVRGGGKYDGMLGVLTGIAAVKSLIKDYGKPQNTVEVVAICEEESSRFTSSDYIGSRNIAGVLTDEELEGKDGE